MNKNLITLAVAGTMAMGGFAVAKDRGSADRGWRGHGRHGNPLEHMTETLNLTPDQQAKVQPILDQARPQIRAIHQEAKQKTRAVMDSTMAQIRPLLTPEQQKKADDLRKAHEDMRNAAEKLHQLKAR